MTEQFPYPKKVDLNRAVLREAYFFLITPPYLIFPERLRSLPRPLLSGRFRWVSAGDCC